MIRTKKTDEDVVEIAIENEYLKVTALNYGAIITGIYLKPDLDSNLVLSYESRDSYFTNQGPYLNAMVGPVAGRIAYGRYEMDQQEYQLSTTQEKHHLHGGDTGISKQFFKVHQSKEDEVQFRLKTNHDQDGFHGDFDYSIQYRLLGNALQIESTCTPTKKTILNMTSHLYFNLSGKSSESILNHQLQINASQRVRIHPEGHPVEKELIEDGSAYDFRTYRTIESFLNREEDEIRRCKGLDTPFILDESKEVRLKDAKGQCTLLIQTTAPCAVIYSAGYLDESLTFKGGQRGYPYCGLAIELQDVPNGVNLGSSEKRWYGPDNPYQQKTTYQFIKS